MFLACRVFWALSIDNFSISNKWFYRGRKFYGKTIVEAIQSPGEIVYVPNNVPHAVYNLDETVAMNDKPYFHTAIEESAFQFFHQQPTFFARFNGTEIVINNGTLNIILSLILLILI